MARPEPLDWDDLRYFLAAVQQRTLAGSARTLGVEHTTVGRRLSALERSLGAAVVMRRPDGIHLTPLGEKLAPLAREVERAVSAITRLSAQERARIRLAVPSGFTHLFAAELTRLRREHPGIELEIISSARPADLKAGEADLAVRVAAATDPDLVCRKVTDSGWSLYASPKYLARKRAPADPRRLAGHELIGFDASVAQAPPARWIEEHARDATIVLRSREMTDVLAAALSGIGLAVLPCLLADREPNLRRVTDEVLITRPVSLVYRREMRVSANLRIVTRFIERLLRDHAAEIAGRRNRS